MALTTHAANTGNKHRHLSELSAQECALLDGSYTRQRQCCHCGESYVEMQNLGRLGCRLHPGVADLDRYGQYVYSCCGRDAEDERGGCLRSDHMDQMPPTDDGEARHASLIGGNKFVSVIPTVLFEYGVMRPLNETILARHDGRPVDRDIEVRYRLPFNSAHQPLPRYTLGEMVRTLSGQVTSNRLLSHIYGIDDRGAEHRNLMRYINDRWPESCLKKEDKPSNTAISTTADVEMHSDGVTEITPPTQYIIPFVVISRLAL